MRAISRLTEGPGRGLRVMLRPIYVGGGVVVVGEEVPMPDGTILRAEDVLEDAKPGRKVVICGDTCDASTSY